MASQPSESCDQCSGVRSGLGHSSEVVFNAKANPCLARFRREGFQGFTQFCPSCRVIVVTGVPGTCINTDPVGAEQVCGLYGAAEFVDCFAPFHVVQGIDGGGVWRETHNGYTCAFGRFQCLHRGAVVP